MSEIFTYLQQTPEGSFVATMIMSMLPVIELRGGIPFGEALGLSKGVAFAAAVIGNMIPVPFIIIFIRKIFLWIRTAFPVFGEKIDKLERRAHIKGQVVSKYKTLGLCILVAIPLPGTGAWTGALVAAILDIRLRNALPAIILGVLIAGFLVSGVVSMVVALY